MKHACLVVLLASAAAIGPFGKKKQVKIGGAASALDEEIALLDAQIDAQTRKLRALRALRRSGAPAPAAGDDVRGRAGPRERGREGQVAAPLRWRRQRWVALIRPRRPSSRPFGLRAFESAAATVSERARRKRGGRGKSL